MKQIKIIVLKPKTWRDGPKYNWETVVISGERTPRETITRLALPSIVPECTLLMGERVRIAEEVGSDTPRLKCIEGKGKFYHHMPPFKARIALFHTAMDKIEMYEMYDRLVNLAAHRRQVTNIGSCWEIDSRFFGLMCAGYLRGALRLHDLALILERMPPRSIIRERLARLIKKERSRAPND